MALLQGSAVCLGQHLPPPSVNVTIRAATELLEIVEIVEIVDSSTW